MLLKAIREKIIDLNPFDLLTYDSVVECSVAVNGEQYYNLDNHNAYFYQHVHDGALIVSILENDDDLLTIEFSLRQNGSHAVQIEYGGVVETEYNSYVYENIGMDTFVYVLEEDYFQQSTVKDLGFTLEENNMIIAFLNKAYELIKLRNG